MHMPLPHSFKTQQKEVPGTSIKIITNEEASRDGGAKVHKQELWYGS